MDEETKDDSKEIEKLQTDERFDEFIKLYTTHKIDGVVNPIYKNGTQCVIRAYGWDPQDPKKAKYARTLAPQLLAKSGNLARKVLAAKGIQYTDFIEVAAKNMVSTENPGWWDRVGEITDWKPKDAPAAHVTNNQFNVYNLDSREVKDFNKDFLAFLDKQE